MGMYSSEYYVAMTKSGSVKADKNGCAYAAKSRVMVEQLIRDDNRDPAKYVIEKGHLSISGK